MSDALAGCLSGKCPKCHHIGGVVFDGPGLRCTNEGCSFEVGLSCPLCDRAFESDCLMKVDGHLGFSCVGCGSKVATAKLKYMIENGIFVDQSVRCEICSSPTIHRPEINLSNRCFFFPQCSGQADLFGNSQESLVFLDFETTGLEIGRDSIIEIGALKIDSEGAEHVFQEFIKPSSAVNEKISKFTGIQNEMLDSADSLKNVMHKFAVFLGDATLVAHNADFDIPWFLSACIRHEIDIDDLKVVCTLVWSKSNQEAHHSLGALTRKYGISHRNAHRALADAVSTKELYFIFQNQKLSPIPEKRLSYYRPLTESMISRYSDFVQA